MADSSKLTINISPEAHAFVEKQVARGEYASESDVVSAGIEALREHDAEFERWLHEVAGPIYDRMKADPFRAIPAEEVLRRLDARTLQRKKSA